ncbi:hypothetical protein L484_005233 [Morus notabilis]|uniref:Uncharacterized protein n=1 Tax=Morus notabilis TaxID=981085 RepID=W9SRT2_9ROSA|nr:hypothetical protein L484_005233 [Morus notabilis]
MLHVARGRSSSVEHRESRFVCTSRGDRCVLLSPQWMRFYNTVPLNLQPQPRSRFSGREISESARSSRDRTKEISRRRSPETEKSLC